MAIFPVIIFQIYKLRIAESSRNSLFVMVNFRRPAFFLDSMQGQEAVGTFGKILIVLIVMVVFHMIFVFGVLASLLM